MVIYLCRLRRQSYFTLCTTTTNIQKIKTDSFQCTVCGVGYLQFEIVSW